MKTRILQCAGVAVLLFAGASCTQIFGSDRIYQLAGTGGTSSASTTHATSGGGGGGGGACVPACGEGQACCDAACVDVQSDASNCGTCGKTCAPGATCGASVCACAGGADCKSGEACCGPDGCKDLTADVANCTMCGNACAVGADCSASGCSDWAKWPMTNPVSTGLPNPAAYVGMTGYVLDTMTGLWWQNPVDGQNDQNKSCAGGCTAAEAITYCENLTLAGRSDWRVPTRIELVSIVDYTQHAAALDPVAFAGAPAGPVAYWSSSTVIPADHFSLEIQEGDTATANSFGVAGVRCVRGSANPGTPHYTIKSGTVLDNWTGLTWQQTLYPQPDTWTAATAFCANNTAALPGSGWRLPSLKELQTIVDDSRTSPAIDPSAFPGTPATSAFWTSSQASWVPVGTNAWYVDFELGQTPHDLVGHPYYFRCVR